jgi:diamine N-acetyltransferase
MIQLAAINENNFHECIELKVGEGQKNFVAENTYSLAQAWLHQDVARPFAIYSDDTMVGFVMLAYDEAERECGIWRFMIDAKYQNKGYGKEAMKVILDYIKENPVFDEIDLSYEPENIVADKLYRGFGFLPTGEIDDGEIVMNLKIMHD